MNLSHLTLRCAHMSLLFALFAACQPKPSESAAQEDPAPAMTPAPKPVDTSVLKWVDPFIGTSAAGNTFPGAVRPWGMVSVSPHNDLTAPSGYRANINKLYGFGHVHLSGTGCPDLGNVLVTASTGEVKPSPDDYASIFAEERASAGYYRATLTDHAIVAEATASLRAGVERFTFPQASGSANILIDASHALAPTTESYVRVVSETEVEGWATSGDFCSQKNQQTVHFVARVNKTPDQVGTWNATTLSEASEQSGSQVGAFLSFSTEDQEAVTLSMGISYVSIAGARANLDAEAADFDFERVRGEAEQAWAEALTRIDARGGTEAQRTIFYTALYHALLHPNVFQDVDGSFLSAGGSGVQKADGYTRYATFSLWDSYRTVHPLLSLLYPEQQLDMVKTMLAISQETGWLPKWHLANNETNVMVGDPAAIVLADTYVRGLTDFDATLALEAIEKQAFQASGNPVRPGNGSYQSYGFIPEDDRGSGWVWGAVSTTLEYALADWSAAQLAAALGREDLADTLESRSKAYAHYFDPDVGLLRPKNKDGSWLEPFDPTSTCCDQSWPESGGPGFVEGNAWHYSFFVPHDIPGLIALFGSEQAFVAQLAQAFELNQVTLGNEPDFAYPFLFSYIDGEAWRTQEIVRKFLALFFRTGHQGLPGNDDAGATSAWYVWGAIGLYPPSPADERYVVSSPLFDEVVLTLDERYYDSKAFTIVANAPAENTYIESASLDGAELAIPIISHGQLTTGERLDLTLRATPPE